MAAMCISPVILGNAGLLKGKNATIFPWDAMVDKLKETGAIYTDQEVVVSGNIITGRDPDAAKAFGLAISKALGSNPKYNKAQTLHKSDSSFLNRLWSFPVPFLNSYRHFLSSCKFSEWERGIIEMYLKQWRVIFILAFECNLV